MNCHEISEQFVEYYRGMGFKLLPRASLLDPSVPMSFVMSAGLVQVETCLETLPRAEGNAFVLRQNCFRHFDLDRVGKSNIHLSLFEMPGAFVFGAGGTAITIWRMWDLATQVLRLDPGRLWATYFAGGRRDGHTFQMDLAAYRAWKETSLTESRIVPLGPEHNLWIQGGGIDGVELTRKCGPNTELFYDRGERYRCSSECKPGCRCGRFVEFSNSLFISYKFDPETDELERLETPFTETVIGAERVAMLSQNRDSVFEIACIQPLIEQIHSWNTSRPASHETIQAAQVIADYTRALLFLAADGAPRPGKGGRRRIVRQLIRGVLTQQRLLGVSSIQPLADLLPTIIDLHSHRHAGLEQGRRKLLGYLARENERFGKTLDRGYRRFQELTQDVKVAPSAGRIIELVKQYGFPLPLILAELRRRGLGYSDHDYRDALKHWRNQQIHTELSEGVSMSEPAKPISDVEHEVFQAIIGSISKSMNMPASMWVPDPEHKKLTIAAGVGLPARYRARAYLNLEEESVTGQAFKRCEVVQVQNILTDRRWKYRDQAEEMGWKSVLCVPVLAHDTVIGVISIYSFVERTFSELEVGLLQDYAAQIRLRLEADSRQQVLTRLLETGHQMARQITAQPQVVLDQIVSMACQVLHADCAVLYPYDPQREDFYDVESIAAYGLWTPLHLARRPRRQAGMAARVKREGEVIFEDIEVEQPDMLTASSFIKRENIRAFMGLALRIADKVMGILYVDYRSPHRFSQEEQNTIRLFAQQAALAIHNSRSFQQSRTRADALKSLHDTLRAQISLSEASENLDDILIQIAQDAQTVLKADLVDLYQYYQGRDKYVLPPILVGERYCPLSAAGRIEQDDVIRGFVLTKQPHYFPKAQKEKTLTTEFTVPRPNVPTARFVIREKIESSAAIPLVVGGEVVGVLFCNYREPQTFPQQQRELIELFGSQAAAAIRNTRLFEQRRALQSISQDITGILDPDELLQSILNRSLELLGCEIGSIALLNPDTNRIEFQYAIGKASDLSVAMGEGLMGAAAQERRAVRVGDVTQDERYIQHVAETHSELDVPMLIGKRLVGVLNAESPYLDAFDRDDEELALVLAGQAAVAIYNAQLFQAAQERVQQRLGDLRGLQEVYEAIGRESLEEVLRRVIERATDLTSAQYGSLWLLEQNQTQMRYGGGTNRLGQTANTPALIPVNEQSINGWVAKHGQSYLCSDVTQDKHYLCTISGIRSELTVPLRHGDRVLGTLNVEGTQLAAFTDDHRQLLEALASQAAIAIDRARNYERLNALSNVNQAIATSENLDALLDNILEQALQALETEFGSIQLLDRKTNTLQIRVSRGERSGEVGEELRSGEGVTGWVAAQGQSILVSDAQTQDDEQSDAPQFLPYFSGTRCELAAPIQDDGRTIGVLNFEHRQPFAFDEQDLRLAETIATQTAVAVRKIRLYQNQQALNRIGQALTGDIRLTEQQIVELLYAEATGLMDTDNMYIALYDEPTDRVRFGLAYYKGERVDVANSKPWQPRTGGKGKTEAIIHSKAPIFHETAADAEMWYKEPGHEEYVGSAFGCWIGVPMMVGARVVGVIATFNPDYDYVYSRDDLDILQVMANQAAVALDNANMWYNVNHRLSSLVEFGRVISSGINLHERQILELVHKHATPLMDTDNMYIALYDAPTDTVRFGLAYMDGKRINIETNERWQPRRGGQGKTETIIHTQKPLFHPTQADSIKWYKQQGHHEYVGSTFGSWVGVPMIVGDEILGVVATYHPDKDDVYDSNDLTILEAMANQAAVALKNAQTYYDVELRLRVLFAFGQEIASNIELSEDEIFELVLGYASELMNTDNLSISLYDAAADEARFVLAIRGGQRIDVEHEEGWGPRPGWEGTGKTNHVIRTKNPLQLFTFKEEEDWYAMPQHTRYIKERRASWLGVPMLTQGEILGVIEVYHLTHEYAFSSSDRDVLQSMADQAAIALHNARLLRRTRELQAKMMAEQELTTLGAAMAALQHRINNSFNIIVPNVRRLRRRVDPDDEEATKILNLIDRNARYTSTIIKRIQTPLQQQERETLDVNAALNFAMIKVQKDYAESSIEIVPELDDTIPSITASVGQITEVFTNLIENACRAMPNGGRLTVSSTCRANRIEVQVQDTGGGIPEEIQERLFERPVPSVDPAHGSGIGLWLSRLMLGAIGGEVGIEYTGPTGTSMLVKLPLSQTETLTEQNKDT